MTLTRQVAFLNVCGELTYVYISNLKVSLGHA